MPGKELAHLAKLPKLIKLNLGGARIDDSALAFVSQIKQLEDLKLFHAVAVGDAGIPALAALTKLKVIEFGSVRITDRALEHLSKMPSLEEIHLAETWLTYEGGLRHLKQLPNLKKLKLKDVVVAAEDPEKLKTELPGLAVELKAPDEKMLAKMTAEKTKLTATQKKTAGQ